MWIQITTSWFVAGLKYKNNIVFEAAPVLKYMEGWTLDAVKEYCHRKGWEYICV